MSAIGIFYFYVVFLHRLLAEWIIGANVLFVCLSIFRYQVYLFNISIGG